MSDPTAPSPVDMVRWTFSVAPEHRPEIEAHLTDLGLDVVVVGDSQFHVTWEEPDCDRDEVASELWNLNQAPFDIVQEEFHRLSHDVIHADDSDAAEAA